MTRLKKAIEAFGEFRQVIEEMKVHTTRAIATSATREAINGDNLVNRIYNSSGVQLERISGGEEARPRPTRSDSQSRYPE